MNPKKICPVIIALLVLTSIRCQGLAPEESPLESTPIRSTATIVLSTPVPPTATRIPPTAEPSIIIQLSKSKMVDPIGLEVIKGKYRLVSGTELWEGSNISVQEDWMTFPPGLAIHVGEGGVTLKGKTYPDGARLIVDADGNLAETTEAASIPFTNTPLPTRTDGILFRDDFVGELQSGWEWQNENLSRWEITPDGWLQIIGEDVSLLANGAQNNLLCRDAPEDDFQIEVHVYANPTEDFQQATLYLYKDGDNFVAINRGYCSPCETGGNGVFMENMNAGSWKAYNVKTQDTDVLLQLVRRGNTITGYYAFEAGEWHSMGEVENDIGNSKICLGVSNVDSAGINADLVGKFDYLEISQP